MIAAATFRDVPERDTASAPVRADASGWSRRVFWIALVVGLAARAWMLWCFAGQPLRIEDAEHYNTLAVSLVTRHDFADAPGRLTSARPPFYPAFLAGVYSVCGVENFQAVRVVQTLLGLWIVALVHRMARDLYSVREARWAAAFALVYPSLIVFANLLLTEILFALFVCLACRTMQRFLARGSWTDLTLLGVWLGLGALTRSVLWMFGPPLVIFLLITAGSGGWRRRLLTAAVPIAAFCLVLLPWTVRNTRLQKTTTVVDCMGGRNFMMGNYEHTPLYRMWDAVGVTGSRSWHRVLAAETPGFEQLTQGQRDKLAMRRGLRYALIHPSETAKRTAVRFFNFWQLERTVVAGMTKGYWGERSKAAIAAAAAVIVGGYVVTLLSGVFGFAVVPPDDRRMHWFLLLLIGFVCAAHTAVFAHSRYHLSLMPLVCVYSGAACGQFGEIWRRRRSVVFWAASAVSLVLMASWAWEVVFVEWWRLRG